MDVKNHWKVSLALQCNQLMKQYIQERLEHPYDGPQTTSKYVALAVDLLSNILSNITEIDENVDSLADSLLLVKCFSATVFAPAQPASRMGRFLDWVHSVQPELTNFGNDMVEQILSSPKVSSQSWKLIRSYVLFGQIDQAQLVLNSSDMANDPLIQDLLGLLRSYPTCTSKISAFMIWRQGCLAFMSNLKIPPSTNDNKSLKRINNISKQVEIIALMLSGSSEDILRHAETWVDALCGLCLYTDPTFEDLESNFQLAYSRLGMTTSMPTWEEGCQALFDSRVVAALGSLKLLDLNSAIVISEFCQETDLLRKYGYEGAEVRESLGLEYIEELVKFPELVEVAVEMLVNLASSDAKQYARQVLPELVKNNATLVDLAVDAAYQLGLDGLDIVIYENAALTCWENGRYTAAVELWYRSGNSVELHQRSWKLFRHILVTRQVPEDEVTLAVLTDFSNALDMELPSVVRDNLAPAAVLVGLLTALGNGNIEGIVTHIRALLAFPNPPLEYYPLLVVLVSQAPIRTFATSEVLMLMDALDLFDNASEEVKQASIALINEAASYQSWDELNKISSADTVWCLRKQLAREIML